ncbi:MAG: Zn-dependent alcohol dehydrogenase [uncultured archaeon A07HR60]|jgi:Zn-dependent alcohol dehydrogenases|nr:MAG: Zn-dependent alcohol dehydrogenase [uncultured archaeon A07HR60]
MADTMNAAVVSEPGGDFEIVERSIPEPSAEEVCVAVDACGVCHSDVFVKEGQHPAVNYPRVPGHEIAGRVHAVGERVDSWAVGDIVGAGWHGGHCFECEPCHRGQFLKCENSEITGLTFDGGYAEFTTVPAEALAAVPEELRAVDAAPLMCAGVTTYNALRNADLQPGDLVAVQGVGGLGHLGIQYAYAAGYETVAISRSQDKESLARELGADHFVNAAETDPAEELQALGGADAVLATPPSGEAISSVVGGIGINGSVIAVGIPGDEVAANVQHLVGTAGSVEGWGSGHARDSQDTMEFSALRDITPKIETYGLDEVETAYDRMVSNDARFRAVLEL